MNVTKINSLTNYSKPVTFKNKKKDEYENPISRDTERNLAILSSTGGSLVAGAITYGLATCFENKEIAEASFMKKHKVALIAGAVATALGLIVTLPAAIYNRKVEAFVKEKEMDVFSRDRELKTNLTEEVGNEVKDPEVDLDKKLDDNLKLQMANRGGAIGIANVTPQS